MADSQSSGKPKVVLNRQLLDGRDKPIITCLEFIRQYLMKRIVIVQQLINKSSGPITPNATKIFNNIKKEAAQSSVLWNGGDLYQATSPHGTQTWQPMVRNLVYLSHGLVNAIGYLLGKNMYRFKINPCNGQDMWKKSPSPITLTPPDYHTPVGRPPKKRKKSAAELFDGIVKNGKLSRAGKSVTCNKCGQVGHNSRSCKGQRGPQAYASVSAARPSGNHLQASQASVTPSTPTVSQSQTFV
ncbi:mutator type transposase, partial [Tanacetum coccineum]